MSDNILFLIIVAQFSNKLIVSSGLVKLKR